jgi:hypothetical protein
MYLEDNDPVELLLEKVGEKFQKIASIQYLWFIVYGNALIKQGRVTIALDQ